MMEFLKNCYVWVAENYNKIMMVLSSTQFASLVAGLVLLWKTILSTKANTDSSKLLNDTVSKNNRMSDNVISIKEENKSLKKQNEELKATVDGFEKKFDTFVESVEKKLDNEQSTLVKKLNSIIDVQSIVYATIRDDNVRNTINSILVNAKFDETADETKQKLMDEIKMLQAALAEEADKVKIMAEEATSKLEEIVEPKTELPESSEPASILSNFKRY